MSAAEYQRQFRAENQEHVHARDKRAYLRRKAREPGFYLEPTRRRSAKFNAWMAELKSGPCTDCGKHFPPIAMDFDHVRGQKTANVSSLYFAPAETVMEEIAKCELVCACCHRIRTERNYHG